MKRFLKNFVQPYLLPQEMVIAWRHQRKWFVDDCLHGPLSTCAEATLSTVKLTSTWMTDLINLNRLTHLDLDHWQRSSNFNLNKGQYSCWVSAVPFLISCLFSLYCDLHWPPVCPACNQPAHWKAHSPNSTVHLAQFSLHFSPGLSQPQTRRPARDPPGLSLGGPRWTPVPRSLSFRSFWLCQNKERWITPPLLFLLLVPAPHNHDGEGLWIRKKKRKICCTRGA